jgi:uncharacterized lipoprotein YajG
VEKSAAAAAAAKSAQQVTTVAVRIPSGSEQPSIMKASMFIKGRSKHRIHALADNKDNA